MDAAELVAWFRIIQTDPYYGTTIQARFELAADTIERLQKERDDAKERADYRGELAKTLRSMSDDHRMVPDFSEQLLDIADAIERLQKENSRLREPRCINEEAGDPCKFCGARLDTDVCRDGTDHIIRERDAALAAVERLKAEIGELAGKWAGDMAADLLSGVSTVKD